MEEKRDIIEIIATKTAKKVANTLTVREKKKEIFTDMVDNNVEKQYYQKTKKYLDNYYRLKEITLDEELEKYKGFDEEIEKDKNNTRIFCNFVETVLEKYKKNLDAKNDIISKRKKNIVNDMYLKGMDKKEFLNKHDKDYCYDSDKTNRDILRRYINSIVQDITPYFFGVNGL